MTRKDNTGGNIQYWSVSHINEQGEKPMCCIFQLSNHQIFFNNVTYYSYISIFILFYYYPIILFIIFISSFFGSIEYFLIFLERGENILKMLIVYFD